MSFLRCVLVTRDSPGVLRGALLRAAQWSPGRVITISFLDGDRLLQGRVRAVAEQWLSRTSAQLRFQWRSDTNETDLRISFRFAGSWSLLGQQALGETDHRRPTMNFEWLNPESSDADVQQVVLHEFGHALGLIHEHQSPEATIPWNREAVIRDLSGPPNNWSIGQIERNVFTGFDRREVLATPFDPTSIMLYPIDDAWTIGGYHTVPNTDLSERDIQLIRDIYG